MTEVTTDNAARAAAWVSETSLRTLERDGEDSMWVTKEHREIDSCTVPLYSAATVTALEAEVANRRERHERTERDACMWASRAESAEKRADAAERRVAELEDALRMARDELGGLPHSLGYEFTHLPKIDAALTGAGAK